MAKIRTRTKYDAELQQIAVEAYLDTAKGPRFLGHLFASNYGRFFGVFEARVRNGLQHRGIGTKLYEAAAAEACRHGRPLASDDNLRHASKSFWEKQVRKGRATFDGRRYTLACPVTSLKGR